MKLEPEDIRGFQELWKRRFGEEIDESKAQLKANILILMMKNLYQPIPKTETLTQLNLLSNNENNHEI